MRDEAAPKTRRIPSARVTMGAGWSAVLLRGDADQAFLNTDPRLIRALQKGSCPEVTGQLRHPHRCLARRSCA
jgi:hypothetical protein